MAITALQLARCQKKGGIRKIYVAPIDFIDSVVADVTDTKLIGDINLVNPADKFVEISLNGNTAVLDLGGGDNAINQATLTLNIKEFLQSTQVGGLNLEEWDNTCGLAFLITLADNTVMYLGADGVNQTTTFMGDAQVALFNVSGTSGASLAETITGTVQFRRGEQEAYRCIRGTTATFVSTVLPTII